MIVTTGKLQYALDTISYSILIPTCLSFVSFLISSLPSSARKKLNVSKNNEKCHCRNEWVFYSISIVCFKNRCCSNKHRRLKGNDSFVILYRSTREEFVTQIGTRRVSSIFFDRVSLVVEINSFLSNLLITFFFECIRNIFDIFILLIYCLTTWVPIIINDSPLLSNSWVQPKHEFYVHRTNFFVNILFISFIFIEGLFLYGERIVTISFLCTSFIYLKREWMCWEDCDFL